METGDLSFHLKCLLEDNDAKIGDPKKIKLHKSSEINQKSRTNQPGGKYLHGTTELRHALSRFCAAASTSEAPEATEQALMPGKSDACIAIGFEWTSRNHQS